MRPADLERDWRNRQRSTPIDAEVRLSMEGLVIGAGTVLFAAGAKDSANSKSRLSILMSVAHLRAPSATALAHLEKAAQRWAEGDAAMASMHLALSGLGRLKRPSEAARRLFVADALLKSGLPRSDLLKMLARRRGAASLVRYSPDQPRVPAGSGRTSGEWTDSGAGGASGVASRPQSRHGMRQTAQRPTPARLARPNQAPSTHHGAPPSRGSDRANPPVPRIASVAGAGGTAAGGVGEIDLGGLSESALAALARFAAGLGISASAGVAAVAGGFGVNLLFPSSGPTGRWVHVPGPGDISYFQSPDVPSLVFRYTDADGKRVELKVGPDRGGNYRDPRSGKVFARWVKTAGKVGLLIATDILLKPQDRTGSLCPKKQEENHGTRGREYEDYVKQFFNPLNPTPSGFGYGFINPRTRSQVVFDDCQHKSGVLAEFKGLTYEDFLLNKKFIWSNAYTGMIAQAARQVAAAGGRPIIWFFDSKKVKEYVERRFRTLFPTIKCVWLPMPRKKK
jgi:hypothetical protein